MLFSSLPYGLFSGRLHEEPKLPIILNYLHFTNFIVIAFLTITPFYNSACQLSLWEETGEPRENPRFR